MQRSAKHRFHFACVTTACFAATMMSNAGAAETPDFGRDVRPILAKHCFTCHGPDEDARESDLRLDTQPGATADLGGYRAIEPGEPETSELFLRIISDDDDTRMPPADSHAPLSESKIQILKAWIESGGKYTEHWAFVSPQHVRVPPTRDDPWCRNPIDAFILDRMSQAGLSPAAEAEPVALLRRVYLDLTGVNPTPEEAHRFLSDQHPAAYERLVDRLLASPAYAERFARHWLDLARYSDTNGYEKDRERTIWPYRDWVIQAISADMPFDQFSIEQLAGDMLPGATRDQRIATGFHRNTMMNEEGGIDPLEYRFYAMVDRVATTGTVWMGLTTGCAQCHTHKYDPITHTDYYALLALMNQADEPEQTVPDPETAIERRRIESEILAEENRLARRYLPGPAESGFFGVVENRPDGVGGEFIGFVERAINNVRDWKTIRPVALQSTKPILREQPDGSILASGDVTKRDVYQLRFKIDSSTLPITALRLEVLPHPLLPAGGPGMAFYEGRRGDFFLSELSAKLDGRTIKFTQPSHSYGKISVGSGGADAANVIDGEGSTGWSTAGAEGKANRLILNLDDPITESGELEIKLLFERHFAAALGRFRFSVASHASPTFATNVPANVDRDVQENILASRPIRASTYAEMQRHFVRTSASLKKHRTRLDRLYRSVPESVRTLVMRERPPRDYRSTRRHHRGEYLSAKEEVSPAIPEVFGHLDPSQPANRLALARWLVSKDNPLVARVTANRAWRAFFGTGIVRTAGDFGTQSEPPSHPHLLDWLANDLVAGQWSMKHLHRRIVLSSTYRQSVTRPAESDPDQRLLSGFPHRRLDAEQVRDVMLSAARLMTHRMGGPSVYPPQPENVVRIAYGSPSWPTSEGGDRYRRSLYTFSKRTAPFAALLTFDAPSGELCVSRRDRSTTPLQALTLMNDEMYVEIARHLASSAIRSRGDKAPPEDIVDELFWQLFVRQPSDDEQRAVIDFFHRQQQHDEPWALVARALMNTDEAITTP